MVLISFGEDILTLYQPFIVTKKVFRKFNHRKVVPIYRVYFALKAVILFIWFPIYNGVCDGRPAVLHFSKHG